MDLNKATSISFYLRTGRIHIFTDAIRTLGEPSFIRFLLNQDGTSMIMEPYHTKEFQSIKVPQGIFTKTATMEFGCKPFCSLLEYTLGWNPRYSYRIPGKIMQAQHIALFDLTCAVKIENIRPTKYTSPVAKS